MSESYSSENVLVSPVGGHALGRIRDFETVYDEADRQKYLAALGLFGTAGQPGEVFDWRAAALPRIEEELALRDLTGKAEVYNPLKLDWQPEDAALEAHHLACDATIVLPVLDLTTAHGSLAETGFAALSGILRPQSVHMYIESGADFDDAVRRARTLTSLLAQKTLKDFPIKVTMAPDLQTMIDNGVRDIGNFVERAASRVNYRSQYTIQRRTDLQPRIALVGSGAAQYEGSWYEGIRTRLQHADVPSEEQYSAYAKDWTLDDALEEIDHKTNDAVVLFAVTEGENSFGAMGELGWLMTYCVLNGQKLGIYVEKHASDERSEQNRQRKLAMAHLGRHLLDFPDLPVFIANSPAELARYGASELAKYKQLRRASQIANLSGSAGT